MKKKWFWIFLLLLAHCGRSPEQKPDDEEKKELALAVDQAVVMTIDGSAYSNLNVKEFIKIQYGDTSASQKNRGLLSRLFDRFIEHEIVLYFGNKENIEVQSQEIDNYLKQMNLNKDRIDTDQKTIADIIKVEKFLYARVYKDVSVTDQEVRIYYQSHIDDFRKTEEIFLYQILVKDREKAIKIRAELQNAPNRFEEIASRESESPEKANNGLMGYFERGVLPKEMEDVVFSLKIGEISLVVESPYGFHIFKVAKKSAKRLRPMAAVRGEVYNKLLSEKLTAAYQQFLEQLKKEIRIALFYDRLYFPYEKYVEGDKPDESRSDAAVAFFSSFHPRSVPT